MSHLTVVCDLLPVAVSGVAEILPGVAEIKVIELLFVEVLAAEEALKCLNKEFVVGSLL